MQRSHSTATAPAYSDVRGDMDIRTRETYLAGTSKLHSSNNAVSDKPPGEILAIPDAGPSSKANDYDDDTDNDDNVFRAPWGMAAGAHDTVRRDAGRLVSPSTMD